MYIIKCQLLSMTGCQSQMYVCQLERGRGRGTGRDGGMERGRERERGGEL